MTITLHWFSGSPFVWRVQFALELKVISYTSKRMDMSSGENKRDDFLRLNPRGKVPVLTDGDTTIYESVAILAYLDLIEPEVPIFGDTPANIAHVWQRIAEFDTYTGETLAADVFRPLLFGSVSDDPDAARSGADRARSSMHWIETVLGSSPYLARHHLTAADIVAMPHLQMLARLGRRPEARQVDLGFDNLAKSHPAIQDWLLKIERLPAYDASYPPHWRS